VRANIFLWGAATIALAGCTRPASDDNALNQTAPDNAVEAPAPIDASTSPEAAAVVVSDYGALVERGAFAEAAKHWTNATAAAQFTTNLEDYPKFKLTAGKPEDEEGAAGSIFISVPVTLDLTLRSGSPYQMTCKATLRRVNDVPGSTAEQRRWHIETIAC
jgi:hypothetical protein